MAASTAAPASSSPTPTAAEDQQQASREGREKSSASSGAGTQMQSTTRASGGYLSDLWSWNGVLKIFIFFIAYLLYAVALEWVEERLLSGVSEDFEAIQRQLRAFGVVSQLMAVALSGVFLFFGWMAFRHELSLPLFVAPLGHKCLTVASYLPKELYLFLFLTGQVGKRLALACKAGVEWVTRVRRILAAQRHLQGKSWARVARDAATLRFAEYIFLLLFLVDSLGSKSEGDNHACAEVAAFLLACEFVALLLNLAVTFPNDYCSKDGDFMAPTHNK
ncbi:uncharacterized protein ACA1_283720 [Acanthamoeba castellanii str. Neff]|uniref:Uncharacterized protein n=1 Tax=Acanthamoeba castellanii (strain ATCC 30010 / Neff) TaxID=1257118 RepID=L8H6M7_ACACF|nr:uncharacterized protein ACA1_283720 [Acanthamoeba castellanii str. Neff]ELR21154.1 hypothetical protein ACA1_283720 [Acanthamoeba castellanii str. Neff]